MTHNVLVALTFLCALGCGLNAGVFFAFSAFVMKGLERLPAAQGIAAMQALNVAAITPWFMAALFGTAGACVALAISSLFLWHRPGVTLQVAGSLIYLGGTILVTMVCNVPRNESLAATSPGSVDDASLWASYVAGWTAWNHLRAAAALAAAALLTAALRLSVVHGRG